MTILDQLADYARYRVQQNKQMVSLEEVKEGASSSPKLDFEFEKALKGGDISFICECKKASPSKRIIAEQFQYIDIAREYDYSEKLMIDLKAKGYKVYLLSNYPDKLSDMHWSKFKFLKQMDGYIISSKVKLIKPNPEIYKLLESKFGIKLSESIFVDDRQINVDAAEKLGMKGILFTGIDDLTKKLIFC